MLDSASALLAAAELQRFCKSDIQRINISSLGHCFYVENIVAASATWQHLPPKGDVCEKTV